MRLLIIVFFAFSSFVSSFTNSSDEDKIKISQSDSFSSCTSATSFMIRDREALPPISSCTGHGKWRMSTLPVPNGTYEYSYQASASYTEVEFIDGTSSFSRNPVVRINGCGSVTFTLVITCPSGSTTLQRTLNINQYCC